MRARWLKPEFFTDKKIGPLGMCAALVFEALWCAADDGGVAECDAVLLKGQMFIRWDEITVAAIEIALCHLTEAGLTQHYLIGDVDYYLIRSWKKNQRVHNPGDFRHPRPTQAVTGDEWGTLPQEGGSGEAGVPPSSHPIYLDSQTPRLPESQTPNNGSAPEFEEIWAAYPKRAGGDSKSDALLAFKARIKSGEDPVTILAGVKRYAAFCDATDKTETEYVKQARTFLGRSRHYLELWDLPAVKPAQGKRAAPGEYDYSKPTDRVEDIKWQ